MKTNYFLSIQYIQYNVVKISGFTWSWETTQTIIILSVIKEGS